MSGRKRIARGDILPPEVYAESRRARRQRIMALKAARRVAVGPYAMFYFENYDTMFQQIHEMLHIEKGGAAQIEDELNAYNPLIPQGRELVATLMFEIDAPQRRLALLSQLGDVELGAYVEVGAEKIAEKIMAAPEHDIERTTAEGKTSSVHFLHFRFTEAQIKAFTSASSVSVGIDHAHYTHKAGLSEATRAALAQDFDPVSF